EIPDAAVGVAGLEPAIELRIAVTRMLPAEAKGSVHAQHPRRRKAAADAANERPHRAPGHDVQRVGAEHRVHGRYRPGMLARSEEHTSELQSLPTISYA